MKASVFVVSKIVTDKTSIKKLSEVRELKSCWIKRL